jgi:holo-[acyl-carrier protein] synthase
VEQAGVGVTMLEIARVKRARARRPRLVARALSAHEQMWCERSSRPDERYAAMLAAHGAVLKAIGAPVPLALRAGEIDVEHENNAVSVRLSGRAEALAAAQHITSVALSLSYTREIAVANAVAMTDAVKPQQRTEISADEELRQSFKRARSVLDELDQIQETGLVEAGGAEDEQLRATADFARER